MKPKITRAYLIAFLKKINQMADKYEKRRKENENTDRRFS